jgi:GNAT superfamily N-acetyltransferase
MGSALLEVLEARAKAWGLTDLTLGSSADARAFYERHGYVSAGDPSPAFGTSVCFPYRKQLGGSAS